MYIYIYIFDIYIYIYLIYIYVHIVYIYIYNMLEHVHGKHEVVGSNPTWANFLYEIEKP